MYLGRVFRESHLANSDTSKRDRLQEVKPSHIYFAITNGKQIISDLAMLVRISTDLG